MNLRDIIIQLHEEQGNLDILNEEIEKLETNLQAYKKQRDESVTKISDLWERGNSLIPKFPLDVGDAEEDDTPTQAPAGPPWVTGSIQS